MYSFPEHKAAAGVSQVVPEGKAFQPSQEPLVTLYAL
jgi:hypothetical protein